LQIAECIIYDMEGHEATNYVGEWHPKEILKCRMYHVWHGKG